MVQASFSANETERKPAYTRHFLPISHVSKTCARFLWPRASARSACAARRSTHATADRASSWGVLPLLGGHRQRRAPDRRASLGRRDFCMEGQCVWTAHCILATYARFAWGLFAQSGLCSKATHAPASNTAAAIKRLMPIFPKWSPIIPAP